MFSVKEMSTVPAPEEAVEQEEMEVGEAVEKEKVQGAEDNKGPAGFPQASSQSNPQSSQAAGPPSTPVLPFK